MDGDNLMFSKVSEAHPETMDFLSHAWCDFAVQALQPDLHDRSSTLVRNNSMKAFFEGDTRPAGYSWIWMQQATHPESNYNGCFQKKQFQWKMPEIKKWIKEIKEKRKDEKRLQRAEVHAALSLAGLATALATITNEASNGKLEHEPSQARKAAMASATALVASQCVQVAGSMGAKKDELSRVIDSALSWTSTSDLLTLTMAATTSLRAAATLKARAGSGKRLNSAPVLPIELDNSKQDGVLEFEKCRLILAKGTQLTIQTADGKCVVRLISLHLNNEAKVILRIKKRNMLNIITSKKQCLVMDVHAELFKDHESNTCYEIVLTTTKGIIKLDMGDNYQRYKLWAITINRMMMFSS